MLSLENDQQWDGVRSKAPVTNLSLDIAKCFIPPTPKQSSTDYILIFVKE